MVELKSLRKICKILFGENQNSFLPELEHNWNNLNFNGQIIKSVNWYCDEEKEEYNIEGNKEYKPSDVLYEINEYGYRTSKETNDFFNENLVACFGCSNTFGYGLPWSETWSTKLNDKLGVDWCVKNYGICGASMDTISRLIYNYTISHKPKIICCFFPEIFRMELFSDDKLSNFTPVYSKHQNKKIYQNYINIINEDFGVYMFVKNFKFIETICKLNDIKFYWSTWSKTIFHFNDEMTKIFLNENGIKVVEHDTHFCNQPKARDNGHFGREVNEKIAQGFCDVILS